MATPVVMADAQDDLVMEFECEEDGSCGESGENDSVSGSSDSPDSTGSSSDTDSDASDADAGEHGRIVEWEYMSLYLVVNLGKMLAMLEGPTTQIGFMKMSRIGVHVEDVVCLHLSMKVIVSVVRKLQRSRQRLIDRVQVVWWILRSLSRPS
ncbi:uncharacterized protein LOC105444924 [Strongylocentrotus purpuratus]|uniref:Uncharacterized protein n=1 Tax=Strongylocentrotus purpuratus TaxID=7668 RepID=A0A7M7PCF4_STRPU|nr:uncharacterized protein LOC105444924 [Strongylocentrotus purpuratus]|eukprot:XP_011678104.1 PREDICTED: uncharacterized protein LOC105444924 [Strongylocentrotus purpuratus]